MVLFNSGSSAGKNEPELNISFIYGCPTAFFTVYYRPWSILLGPIIFLVEKLSPKKYKCFCRNEPELNIFCCWIFRNEIFIYLIVCIKIHQKNGLKFCCTPKNTFNLIPAHRPFFEPELNISIFFKNFNFWMLCHHFWTKYLLECAYNGCRT